MTPYDYFFRFDRGAFWLIPRSMRNNRLKLFFLGDRISNKNLFKVAMKFSDAEREKKDSHSRY